MKLLKPFVSETHHINIIETAKNNGNKFAYDTETELFKLTMLLSRGLNFLMHFGLIPDTKGEDEETGPERNNRLIAAAVHLYRYRGLNTIKDIDKYLMDEIINVFVTYNQMKIKDLK